jgi:hypothetical protein
MLAFSMPRRMAAYPTREHCGAKKTTVKCEVLQPQCARRELTFETSSHRLCCQPDVPCYHAEEGCVDSHSISGKGSRILPNLSVMQQSVCHPNIKGTLSTNLGSCCTRSTLTNLYESPAPERSILLISVLQYRHAGETNTTGLSDFIFISLGENRREKQAPRAD